MTLLTTLLVLIAERLFKLGEHWQLDHRLEVLFRRVKHFSLPATLLMTALAMAVVYLIQRLLHGVLFNVPLLVFWILLGLLCIGAGRVRLHYHAYLKAASRNDRHACDAMASELTLIHGVPPGCDDREFLSELQNALLWINYRYYLAPLFWFVVGGPWGPITLIGYCVLRAWQTWLARYQTPRHRLQSGIDAILHVVDWLPVRLVGVVYALVGHGERALPAWFASLGDRHSSQYQVLTRLAQFSLAREPHVDKVETPKAAVSMAKKNVAGGGRYHGATHHLRYLDLSPARCRQGGDQYVSAGGMPKSGIPFSCQRTRLSRVWRFGSYSGSPSISV